MIRGTLIIMLYLLICKSVKADRFPIDFIEVGKIHNIRTTKTLILEKDRVWARFEWEPYKKAEIIIQLKPYQIPKSKIIEIDLEYNAGYGYGNPLYPIVPRSFIDSNRVKQKQYLSNISKMEDADIRSILYKIIDDFKPSIETSSGNYFRPDFALLGFINKDSTVNINRFIYKYIVPVHQELKRVLIASHDVTPFPDRKSEIFDRKHAISFLVKDMYYIESDTVNDMHIHLISLSEVDMSTKLNTVIILSKKLASKTVSYVEEINNSLAELIKSDKNATIHNDNIGAFGKCQKLSWSEMDSERKINYIIYTKSHNNFAYSIQIRAVDDMLQTILEHSRFVLDNIKFLK